MAEPQLNFLIYGAGVIGSIFAGKLYNAGYKVTVLARNYRFNELKENGLILQGFLSEKKEVYKVNVIDKLNPEDIYDFILVVMQKTQVEEILPILGENKTSNIVFIVNNPSGYKQWIDTIGKGKLIIGFPSGGGERKNSIISYFIGKGISKAFQTTTFGEIDGSKTKRLKTLVTAFRKAGFSPTISNNIDAWQKTHVSVVFPIANAIYMFHGDNYALGKSSEGIKLMIKATREGFNVLDKLGITVTPKKLNFYRLPYFILVPIFKTVMRSKIAEIAMAKHANIAKEEMKMLQNEFKVLIDRADILTPAIDELSTFNSN